MTTNAQYFEPLRSRLMIAMMICCPFILISDGYPNFVPMWEMPSCFLRSALSPALSCIRLLLSASLYLLAGFCIPVNVLRLLSPRSALTCSYI
ncbi:hypothetical protein SCLCIDRAFT_404393 [Scleroderma citrinum Foug A]|uniref:Uncharacterized protein n=1 Tax=Scleroderma citrinum Foug A TaxID=1036808 RepID=A0A0C3DD12_9AGAM|nr:hypothetical protein SCLCIDRAFT_404393 [Scleroderma citrinum Foug A]